MAGAGYKLFTTGSVLTAAEVNTYLQEQAVMRFATVAARTAALSGVLAEGMVSYIDATDTLEVYNGSAWISAIGDITEVQGSTGISVASGTGPVPVITNSMATAIDAKGDLIVGTADNTFSRLAVSDNGSTLVADSSTSTGLRYTTPVASLANPVINGGFDIWQRGTSISLAASAGLTYTADRWCTQTGANQASTVSRQVTGDTTNLPNIQYCVRYQRNSGQTGTGTMTFLTAFETTNSLPFSGKAVTLSFYARAGSNFSSASSILGVKLDSGTGTDQQPFAGYTGAATVGSANVTLTTTWQRFVVTGTVGATATELNVQFFFAPVGTASTNDFYEVTGVQIDVGTYTASSAPTFRRSGGTLAGELAACQRYLPSIRPTDNCYGFSYSTVASLVSYRFPVTARVAPTGITVLNGLSNFVLYGGTLGSGTPTAINYNTAGVNVGEMAVTTTAGSPTLTIGQGCILNPANSNAIILWTGCEL